MHFFMQMVCFQGYNEISVLQKIGDLSQQIDYAWNKRKMITEC